jgi:transposase InsO family protein
LQPAPSGRRIPDRKKKVDGHAQGLSPRRRQAQQHHDSQRRMERHIRQRVVAACQSAKQHDVPVIHMTRGLALPDRTVRRWRSRSCDLSANCSPRRGRLPRPASRDQRNQVFRILRQRGATTPLSALRAAFPDVPRCDLKETLSRYRRLQKRKRQRHQSRLHWQRPGTVWAADFKERREPIEGRYGWILAVKDLASRCQLAWLPVETADADTVKATYAGLFEEHGPPLVLKSDNGGPFRDEGTKQLLAEYDVIPLFNPRRRPAYNGGVERANGQLAGYQEAVAAYHGREGLPTCADAEEARQIANDLSHPAGWKGPTAAQLWEQRPSIDSAERASFLATLTEQRTIARAALHLPQDTPLGHYPAAAVDRRAVRDTLLAHGLLKIEPRRRPKGSAKKTNLIAPFASGAVILQATAGRDLPALGQTAGPEVRSVPLEVHSPERVHCSTDNSEASGQNYG